MTVKMITFSIKPMLEKTETDRSHIVDAVFKIEEQGWASCWPSMMRRLEGKTVKVTGSGRDELLLTLEEPDK